jgi:zinc transporter ZupT
MDATAGGVGVTALLLFAMFILKLLDFVKAAVARDANALATIVVGWVAGVVAVLAFAHTQWASEIKIGEQTLAGLSAWSQVVFGLVATSVAGYLYDVKKAVDRTDSASSNRLLPEAERERKARMAAALGVRR